MQRIIKYIIWICHLFYQWEKLSFRFWFREKQEIYKQSSNSFKCPPHPPKRLTMPKNTALLHDNWKTRISTEISCAIIDSIGINLMRLICQLISQLESHDISNRDETFSQRSNFIIRIQTRISAFDDSIQFHSGNGVNCSFFIYAHSDSSFDLASIILAIQRAYGLNVLSAADNSPGMRLNGMFQHFINIQNMSSLAFWRQYI